jgi:hypothetical protein
MVHALNRAMHLSIAANARDGARRVCLAELEAALGTGTTGGPFSAQLTHGVCINSSRLRLLRSNNCERKGRSRRRRSRRFFLC